jgi:putative transposase
VAPREIADQNNRRCSLRATGGRPGDRIGGLPVITAAQPGSRPITHLPVEVLRRPVEPGQYVAIRYTERLAEIDAVASIDSVGDSYDNAMAEAFNSLFKAELVRNKGPWCSIDDLELAVAEYIDWYNHRRLHGELGLIPPVEYEALHHDTSLGEALGKRDRGVLPGSARPTW